MGVHETLWGNGFDLKPVSLFTLKEKNIEADISNMGGLIKSLRVKGRDGSFFDVILGFDDAEGYKNNKSCIGAIVGRNCNRIAEGKFFLNNREYCLVQNDGTNNLHTGPSGTHYKTFDVDRDKSTETVLKMHVIDKEEEMSFPGNVNLDYTYTLGENTLLFEANAVPDKDTVINITSHLYFNLSGQETLNLNWQSIRFNSELYNELGKHMIPTGKCCHVYGTCFDFTNPKPILKDIFSDDIQMEKANGYDHNFIIKRTEDARRDDVYLCAVAHSDMSGITMKVYANTPGFQYYTGNFLNEPNGKGGVDYVKRSGFCIEPQFVPNAINMDSDIIAKPIVRSGEHYNLKILYEFTFE